MSDWRKPQYPFPVVFSPPEKIINIGNTVTGISSSFFTFQKSQLVFKFAKKPTSLFSVFFFQKSSVYYSESNDSLFIFFRNYGKKHLLITRTCTKCYDSKIPYDDDETSHKSFSFSTISPTNELTRTQNFSSPRADRRL